MKSDPIASTTATLRSVVGHLRSERDEPAASSLVDARRAALVTELERVAEEQARPAAIRAEIARLDADAEAERQRQVRATAQAQMDELVKADREDLLERRKLYVTLAANKARHVVRWNESEGLRINPGIPNRVYGFDFAGDPALLVAAIDRLLGVLS